MWKQYGHYRDGRGLFISLDAFRTALAGYDAQACARAFARRGYILRGGVDKDVRIQGQIRIEGIQVRGYWLQGLGLV